MPPKSATSMYDHKSMTYSHNTKSKFIPTRNYCVRLGYIRPQCYNYKKLNMPKFSKLRNLVKIWIEKSRLKGFVVMSTLSARKSNMCYLNSSNSRNMIGNTSLFISLNLYHKYSKVIFW